MTVDITVAVDAPEPQLPYDGTDVRVALDEYREWFEEHAARVQAAVRDAKAPVVEFVEGHGGVVSHVLEALPVLRVTVPRDLLDAEELNSERVLSIEAPPSDVDELLGDAAGAASSNLPSLSGGQCFSTPCAGGGMAVGMWERDGGTLVVSGIAKNNARVAHHGILGYLDSPTGCETNADCFVGDSVDRACAAPSSGAAKICVQDHLTWTTASVGMFGAYDYSTTFPTATIDPTPNVPAGTVFGSKGAWDIAVKVGNDSDLDGLNYLVSTTDGAVPYVNRSQAGSYSQMDWPARAYGTFITASAGNFNTVAVTNNLLRNGLLVGMYDYRTYSDPTTHRRTTSGTGSSYLNPLTDPTLERPHLLAPGNHHGNSGLHMPRIQTAPGTSQMVHRDPITNTGISGTSFAAPAAMAMALLTHEYEGWLSPVAYPMVNKAIQLASTRDANADGAIGKSNVWSQSVDAEDGAGEVSANLVKQVLDNNRYLYADLANSSFVSCGTNCRQVQVASIPATVGAKLRVSLAWHTCASNDGSSPVLNNDLDLAVQGSTQLSHPCYGTVSSSAITSEVEMVERSCQGNITYKVFVRIKNGAQLQACGSTTTERVGVAWTLVAQGATP